VKEGDGDPARGKPREPVADRAKPRNLAVAPSAKEKQVRSPKGGVAPKAAQVRLPQLGAQQAGGGAPAKQPGAGGAGRVRKDPLAAEKAALLASRTA